MMLGELLAAHTGEHDFDRDEKLQKADKYLNDAIAAAGAAPKPNPVVTDAEWDVAKKQMIGEGHNGLGMVAMDRKNYDAAIKEFQTAFTTIRSPPTRSASLRPMSAAARCAPETAPAGSPRSSPK